MKKKKGHYYCEGPMILVVFLVKSELIETLEILAYFMT